MAKYENGILGPFRGKVGPVVGRIRKGNFIMSAYRRHISQAHTTDTQVLQRARFALVGNLVPAFKAAINIGLKPKATKSAADVSPANLFFQHAIANAVTGTDPAALEIDPTKLLLAEGICPEVIFSTPNFSTAHKISVTFLPNSDVPGATLKDFVYIFAYLPLLNRGILASPSSRPVGTIDLTLPVSWSGQKAYVYGWSVAYADGEPSNSIYLGTGTIA